MSKSLFQGHLEDIGKFCKENEDHDSLGGYVRILKAGRDALADVSTFLLGLQKQDFPGVALYATQYCEIFGDVTVGWLLLWQAMIAQQKLLALAEEKGFEIDAAGIEALVAENQTAAFYTGKLASARFFLSNAVSLAPAKAEAIRKLDKAALEIAENAF
jgi:hypothetical protein